MRLIAFDMRANTCMVATVTPDFFSLGPLPPNPRHWPPPIYNHGSVHSGVDPGVAIGIIAGVIIVMCICCLINSCNKKPSETDERDGNMVVLDGAQVAEAVVEIQHGCCCGGGGGDGGDGGGCGGCGGGD